MPGFQFYFELIGAVAFAISGAALAVKKHMDLFGVAMMGMTTAVGGGILRDLLLGITPPAALRDPLQALVAIATSLLVFLVWKRFHPEGDHRNWEALLLVADSIGLGIFSVHGAAVAIRAGLGGNVFLTLLVGMLTGVGGGVVLGGKLLTGYTGAAAEPGHMVILDTPDAPRCTCGRPGCLESLASATALIRMTKEAMAAHPESTLHGIAAQSGGVNGRTAFDAAAQGDAAGKAVVEQYIHYLAVGVANMINIFFPEVIGLSGGVANQGENLLAPLRAAVGPMVFGNAYAQKHTRITTCTLGYRAGVIGAALLAKNQG